MYSTDKVASLKKIVEEYWVKTKFNDSNNNEEEEKEQNFCCRSNHMP